MGDMMYKQQKNNYLNDEHYKNTARIFLTLIMRFMTDKVRCLQTNPVFTMNQLEHNFPSVQQFLRQNKLNYFKCFARGMFLRT